MVARFAAYNYSEMRKARYSYCHSSELKFRRVGLIQKKTRVNGHSFLLHVVLLVMDRYVQQPKPELAFSFAELCTVH